MTRKQAFNILKESPPFIKNPVWMQELLVTTFLLGYQEHKLSYTGPTQASSKSGNAIKSWASGPVKERVEP